MEPNETINVRYLDIFAIRLGHNGTTGYQKIVLHTPGLRILDESFEMGRPNMVGSGGIISWKIQAIGTDLQIFTVYNLRSWDLDTYTYPKTYFVMVN